ncbi:hypothetical protein AWZ03_004543 [Drosophila navojoa]|uniref:Uncharacterized protein n=1 Tax=Drosophila navojoa TaxID=7232 RepID=A0A484BJY3_DRONA|nr:nucleoporin Nup43 [Drosophila navojoa]TDG49058.1 hypothetical protein AWZ03_004543 [Drosophila navojoa]
MSMTVSANYVSEKISQIRWLPEKLTQSERFVTGTWDMDTNFVRVWRFHENTYADSVEHTPRCNDKVAMEADVTGIEFVNDDTFVVGCGDGRVSLFKVHRAVEEDQIRRTEHSERIHAFKYSPANAPCTAISIYGTDIATVGEDGRLNVLSANDLKQVKRTIEADSMSLLAVSFVNQNQVVTSNRMGVIRLFDVRSAGDGQPQYSFMAASQDEKSSNFVSSIVTHPMQQHVLICGTEEGSLTVWDLRQLEYPASYLSTHKSAITAIGFHRQDPSKLFTAAEEGAVWMWSDKKLIDASQTDSSSAWLAGDRLTSLINVDGILTNIRKAVNSFDVHGSRMICGTDSETVYLIYDV